MTTLTDFLLARIAEDERDAREQHQVSCELLMCPSCTTGPYPCDCGQPARVLAECVAKRRIIGLKAEPSDTYTPGGYTTDEILRALALPYSAHLDFDPAWRP